MPGGAGPIATSINPFKTRIVERGWYTAFALVTSLFFLWGFCYGLLDVLNSHFQKVLGISKLQSTGLQVAYFGIGYLAFSPVAGEVLRRRGYKFAIIMGLCLYSLGAILFWPVAKFSGGDNKQAIFAGFVVCTAVIACGLATLEVTANSYISVMPPAGPAAFRLQFSQSWNGVASFVGPLIASKFFFSDGNEDNLDNVQWVYLAVAGMGACLAVAFFFVPLPEVSEVDLQAEADALADTPAAIAHAEQLAKPFWRQTRPMLGFLCQFAYVGAQVTIGTFFINYATEDAGLTKAKAATFLSFALIIFTVGRFISTALLAVFSAPFLLMVNAALAAVFIAVSSSIHGMPGLACILVIYFAMSPMYPVIFVVSTENLGRHTRRAASLLVAGVSGGAVFPPIQGALADRYSTRLSFWVSFPAFLYVFFFAFWIWRQKGLKITLAGETAHQVMLAGGATIPPQKTALDLEAGSQDDKKVEAEEFHVERL